MPYRIDPNTGQPVWDGTSIPQASRDSLSTQIRELQAQIDALSFIDLDDVPTTYTGQSGKILSVKSAENGLEFITNSGGAGVTDGDKGDVVVSGTGTVWTIDTGAITTAKIADGQVTVAKTSGFGSIATQASSNVSITGGTITGTTVSGVTISGTSTPTLAVSGTTSVSGTNTGDQTIALTGDVTGSGTGSFAATIASNAVTTAKLDAEAVTYAKIQPLSAASTLLGRGTAGGTTVREIGIGAGLTMSGDTLSASGTGDVTGPASSTANAVARFSLTGGKTLLNSSIVIDDATTSTTNNVTIAVSHAGQTNSSLVLTPQGTGAFIVGPKPDGGTTGGGVRGTNAVDLQTARSNLGHIASGANSFVGVGSGNAATASTSATIGGLANQATAAQAVAHGSRATSNRLNMMAHGNAATVGECQAGRVIMRRTTTDATPVPLSMDGAAPTGATITTSTHFILLNNQAVFADIRVVARSVSGTDHAAFMRRVLIKRDANAASTAIVGTVLSPTADIKSAGATLWDVAITADTSNGGMLITVTGAASTTIVWGASVEFMEIIRT